jgi:hypothetical protein
MKSGTSREWRLRVRQHGSRDVEQADNRRRNAESQTDVSDHAAGSGSAGKLQDLYSNRWRDAVY